MLPSLLFLNLQYQKKTARPRRRITTSGKYKMKFSSDGDEQILDKTVDSKGKKKVKVSSQARFSLSYCFSKLYFLNTFPSIFNSCQFLRIHTGYLRRRGRETR